MPEADFLIFYMFQGPKSIVNMNHEREESDGIFLPGLDSSVFKYSVQYYKIVDSVSTRVETSYNSDRQEWRGDQTFELEAHDSLVMGTFWIDSTTCVHSTETRNISYYVPHVVPDKPTVLYFMDGQALSGYASRLDWLIYSEIVDPIILVGFHSNNDKRYEEYVCTHEQSDVFDAHLDCFINEAIYKSEESLALDSVTRLLYGFSNGAAFAMYMGLNYQDLFQEIIAFSTADYISEYHGRIILDKENYPKFILGAGVYESSIYKDGRRFSTKMDDAGLDVEFSSFCSSHDSSTWIYEFFKYLVRRPQESSARE